MSFNWLLRGNQAVLEASAGVITATNGVTTVLGTAVLGSVLHNFGFAWMFRTGLILASVALMFFVGFMARMVLLGG